jgi:hypothetical protein
MGSTAIQLARFLHSACPSRCVLVNIVPSRAHPLHPASARTDRTRTRRGVALTVGSTYTRDSRATAPMFSSVGPDFPYLLRRSSCYRTHLRIDTALVDRPRPAIPKSTDASDASTPNANNSAAGDDHPTPHEPVPLRPYGGGAGMDRAAPAQCSRSRHGSRSLRAGRSCRCGQGCRCSA